MQDNAFIEGKAQELIQDLSWNLKISFDRAFDEDIDFFTVGVSTWGGGDFLIGDSEIVQEWDKYEYIDHSDRVVTIDWQREQDPFSSVSSAMADIVMENTDGYFDTGSGSPADGYMLPGRPMRLFAGFANVTIPVFVGFNDKAPKVDKDAKTVSFHLIDFLESILDTTPDPALVLQNKRTDEILEELLTYAGLTTGQFVLDPGFNTIGFFYCPSGQTLGQIINDLMVAEGGSFYMDEAGVIRFKNRQNFENMPVWSFSDEWDIINFVDRDDDDIINIITIDSQRRLVQAETSVFQSSEAILIQAGNSYELWASFSDPVSSITPPTQGGLTSSFTVNTAADGSGASSPNITLTSDDLFAERYKMVFTNTGLTDLYLRELDVWGTPAIQIEPISIEERDEASITAYGEKLHSIQNPYFQNVTDAQSKALIFLNDFSTFGQVGEIEVVGTPQLQLGDPVEVTIEEETSTYRVTKITQKLSGNPARYMQILRLKQYEPTSYFTIEVSELDGTDVLSP